MNVLLNCRVTKNNSNVTTNLEKNRPSLMIFAILAEVIIIISSISALNMNKDSIMRYMTEAEMQSN